MCHGAASVLQPLPLSLFAQVHPELDDDRAIVGERALEGGHLVEQRVEFRLVGPSRHAIENRRGVPCAEKDRHAPARGQIAPVPPQARTLTLFA